jgi:hypothetical protein
MFSGEKSGVYGKKSKTGAQVDNEVIQRCFLSRPIPVSGDWK